MAVAVAVLECKDITFILCVSTSQDTVSCKVSVFIHWIYCFQQKIPVPDATTSWWREKSQQAKCQGMCPSSLCFSPVTWFIDIFSKGNCGRLTHLTNKESWHFLCTLNFWSCWASGSDEGRDSCLQAAFQVALKAALKPRFQYFCYFKLKMCPG